MTRWGEPDRGVDVPLVLVRLGSHALDRVIRHARYMCSYSRLLRVQECKESEARGTWGNVNATLGGRNVCMIEEENLFRQGLYCEGALSVVHLARSESNMARRLFRGDAPDRSGCRNPRGLLSHRVAADSRSFRHADSDRTTRRKRKRDQDRSLRRRRRA